MKVRSESACRENTADTVDEKSDVSSMEDISIFFFSPAIYLFRAPLR